MSHDQILKQLPKEGFLKVGKKERPALSGKDKSILIRKGNQLFNNGHFEEAKKIFLTIGYTDGIIRLGDKYYSENRLLEAFRMYWMAPDKHKIDMFAEKMALIIRHWLKEES